MVMATIPLAGDLTDRHNPACTAVPIVLSPAEQTTLQNRIGAARTECRDLVRAQIVMAAAAGDANAVIARVLAVCEATVRKWRGRFAAGGLAGLKDLPRTGRPKVFTDVESAEVKALACELPAESRADPGAGEGVVVALSRWSAADLATEAVRRGIVNSISASTVRRWLDAAAIKPWQHRSWIFPRDPNFATKAARVLDLYARTWQGEPLGPEDYVISADEKSQLQALHRRHSDLPPGPGRTRRVEFEYTRRGTLAYFAAYDVHHARVIGQIAPRPGSCRSPSSSSRS